MDAGVWLTAADARREEALNRQSSRPRPGRVAPYTTRDLARLACVRCHRRAQAQVFVAGDLHRPVCGNCWRLVMELVLEMLRDPRPREKARRFAVRAGMELLPDLGVCERGHLLTREKTFITSGGRVGCVVCRTEDRRDRRQRARSNGHGAATDASREAG